MSRINSFTAITCLVVVLQVSVAAAESLEISNEGLTPSRGSIHEKFPNIDISTNKKLDRHSGSGQRLQDMSDWLDELAENDVERKYMQLSPLVRGQFGFGKRPLGTEDGSRFWRDRKSQLSRMPMSFGKRDAFDIPDNDLYSQKLPEGDLFRPDNDDLIRGRRGKLGRMPMAFGKRFGPLVASTDAHGMNNVSNMQAQFSLNYRSNLDDAFTRVAKDRLGRMPMAFGKRDLQGSQYNEDQYSSFSRPLGKLSSIPYPHFDKSNEEEKHYELFENNIFTNVPDEIVPASSEESAITDREGSNLHYRVPRGSLNRMPLSFGKRAISNKMADLLGNEAVTNKNVAFPEDGSTSIFDKRNPNKYQALFQMLGSKINSRKTEIKGSPDDKLKTLLNQFLGKENSLTRLTRSKLDRMPITYGKRGEDRSTKPGNLDSAYSRVIRPKLGRMPLAFGKRMSYLIHPRHLSKGHPLNSGVDREAGGDSSDWVVGSWGSREDSEVGPVSVSKGTNARNTT